MKRREVIAGLLGCVAIAFPCPAVHGQGADRVRRIGVLEIRPASSNAEYFGVFLSSMRELGYLEGRDFTIEYRHADGRPERFPALAAELVRLAPLTVLREREYAYFAGDDFPEMLSRRGFKLAAA